MRLVDVCEYLHRNNFRVEDIDFDTFYKHAEWLRQYGHSYNTEEYIDAMRSMNQYKHMLMQLKYRGADERWPVYEDIGMSGRELERLRLEMQRIFEHMDVRPRGHVVYWAVRPAPLNTRYIEMLHDTDDCLEHAGSRDERIRRFEICIGMRYRISSYHGWKDRPYYWREMLPEHM